MGNMLLSDKSIAVPGEAIAEGVDFLPGSGAYRDGNAIVASRLGLVYVDGRLIKLIPLSGRYIPKRGDTIIGMVTDLTFSGWMVDTNSAYHAMLSVVEGTSDFVERGANLTRYHDIGDYIVTKIINVTSQKLIDLTMKGPGLKKLIGGRIIHVAPTKVPRIIGKQGTMVTMIKQSTGCRITVGQNGVVWVQGEPEMELKAISAIRKIEEEAHTTGLTESVKEYLESSSDGDQNEV